MTNVTRYWTDHLWPELLVKAESIGAKQVVLASDHDAIVAALRERLDRLIWKQEPRYTRCRFCDRGYPNHERACIAEVKNGDA